MKQFLLYEIWYTGITECDYIDAEEVNDIDNKSQKLLHYFSYPTSPVYITSEKYGIIESNFDIDTTLIPGMKRYGSSDAISFELEWLELLESGEPEYMLRIQGYEDIRIRGLNPVVFYESEKIIAKISSVSDESIPDKSTERKDVKLFEIDDKYIPVLEILGAFMKLRFA